jgi:hypothetical protein
VILEIFPFYLRRFTILSIFWRRGEWNAVCFYAMLADWALSYMKIMFAYIIAYFLANWNHM